MEKDEGLHQEMSQLAAAQLVEQVKLRRVSKAEIPITDDTGEWTVTVELVKKA